MKKLTVALLITASIALLFPSLGSAQGTPMPFVRPQFFDNSGDPCNGCLLNVYASGTTTRVDTYTTITLTGGTENANPVVMDSAGRPTTGYIFLSPSTYRFVLTNSTGGTTYWDYDKRAVDSPGFDLLDEHAEALRQEFGRAVPLRALDHRKRPKKGHNTEWRHPHDPDARITKMKDGRTHLAHKAEHAVDMNTGAVVGVMVQAADQGDTPTFADTVTAAAEGLEAVAAVTDGETAVIDEVVADKGYPSNQVLVDLAERKHHACLYRLSQANSVGEHQGYTRHLERGTPKVVPEIKRMGYKSIINLRLASEPGADIEASTAAAAAAGITYVHVNFSTANPDSVR